jgi:ribosome-binding ATPase YchF (GTP1/OBG family)
MLTGIVGKPNTGKSTFFSAVTMIPAERGSYPFTTIKPNRGIGYVRSPCVCKEFNVRDNPKNSVCIDGIRLIPVELIDCAGLVPGAWRGRGLGNQFLDDIRKADALIHIVDIAGATDSEGKSCEPGSRDPLEDIKFLEVEITMWLVQILNRTWRKLSRMVESPKKDLVSLLEEQLSGLAIKRFHIMEALRRTDLNMKKPIKWSEDDLKVFVDMLRIISKPMLIAGNKIDLLSSEENLYRLNEANYDVIPCSAEAELALRRAAEKGFINYRPGDSEFSIVNEKGLSETQKKGLEAIEEKVLEKFGSTGIQGTLNAAFFQLLNMIVVYPVEDLEQMSDHEGRVLPDAYLVSKGTTARQLAYMIHTEIGESFIYAIEAREKKRVGEDYKLKNRDIISMVSAKKRV